MDPSFMRDSRGFAGEWASNEGGVVEMAIFASFADYIFQTVTYSVTTSRLGFF